MTDTRTTTQEFQGEVLKTVSKSQEAVIDAIKTWADAVKSITPKLPAVDVAAGRRAAHPVGGRGQRLRLRRAAAGQPAQVRRGHARGHRPADARQGQGRGSQELTLR